ncbi:MAG: hypothetical protein IT378_25790 [Sandaracinaceae bacterium]|nr:hypothetical protein [Sandaracinaceae bacterium]
MIPLAERIQRTAPIIDGRKPDDYLMRVRGRLNRACDDGVLAIGPHDISKHVRITESKLESDAFDLTGGRRNFDRKDALADLRMSDGGWIFFAVILRPVNEGLEVLAYNVERVFAKGSPSWIRFDYNEPEHRNDQRGLRSHMHPANDDLILPAPIFDLEELLDLFLRGYGTSPGAKRRKARKKGKRPGDDEE